MQIGRQKKSNHDQIMLILKKKISSVYCFVLFCPNFQGPYLKFSRQVIVLDGDKVMTPIHPV